MNIFKLFKRNPKPVKTYEIEDVPFAFMKTIKCLKCNRTSYNQNDVKQLYCGHCHEYHERPIFKTTELLLESLGLDINDFKE